MILATATASLCTFAGQEELEVLVKEHEEALATVRKLEEEDTELTSEAGHLAAEVREQEVIVRNLAQDEQAIRQLQLLA